MNMSDTIKQVFSAIDALNQQDPNRIFYKGHDVSKEYLNSIYMTEQLHRYIPDPSVALQIACRAHHICRWQIDRTEYPSGKAGYYQWRKSLYRHHSQIARTILEQCRIDKPLSDQVCDMIAKKNRIEDLETQLLEDVICHVFLLHYAEAFSKKHQEEKVIDILEKTWEKLSNQGKAYVSHLAISEAVAALIAKSNLA